MRKIRLTESQFKQLCKLMNEEEQTIVQTMGKFNSPMEAQQCAEFLKQNNIEAFARGNEVLIYAEKDWADDNYAQDTISHAQQLVQQFNKKYKQVMESK